MVNTNFDRRALAEVYNIIIMLEKEKFDKIPVNVIKAIRNNMDEDYDVQWEEIEEGKMLEDTEKILSVLYTDYLATPEEKDIIMKLENFRYNNKYPLFKNKKDNEMPKEEQLIVLKKQNYITNIFNKIKKIFFNK